MASTAGRRWRASGGRAPLAVRLDVFPFVAGVPVQRTLESRGTFHGDARRTRKGAWVRTGRYGKPPWEGEGSPRLRPRLAPALGATLDSFRVKAIQPLASPETSLVSPFLSRTLSSLFSLPSSLFSHEYSEAASPGVKGQAFTGGLEAQAAGSAFFVHWQGAQSHNLACHSGLDTHCQPRKTDIELRLPLPVLRPL